MFSNKGTSTVKDDNEVAASAAGGQCTSMGDKLSLMNAMGSENETSVSTISPICVRRLLDRAFPEQCESMCYKIWHITSVH